MLDLSPVLAQPENAHAGAMGRAGRWVVLVNRATGLELAAQLQQQAPEAVVWLWVVTPSEVVSWGALLAAPEERVGAMQAAVAERMEQARRRLLPLHQAMLRAEIASEMRIAHGAPEEMIVRTGREPGVAGVVIPAAAGASYGQPVGELLATLTRCLPCPVTLLG